MPTRNVVLTEHQEALIAEMVGSGRYQNASEVLREGLRLIETREAEVRARLDVLRAATQVGIDALDRVVRDFADADDLITDRVDATNDIVDTRLEALRTVRAAKTQVDEVLIQDAKAARNKAVPLAPGEILAWRDEGRRNE